MRTGPWPWVRLDEIAGKPQYGWTSAAKPDASGPLLLRTTDITRGPIDWKRVPRCVTAPPDLGRYELQADDIVVSRAGSVGVSALVTPPPRTVFASYLMRLRPGAKVLPKFLRLFLDSPGYWSQVSRVTNGIALPNINGSKLAAVTMPLPPLDEQRRIVEILEDHLSRLESGDLALIEAARRTAAMEMSVLAGIYSGLPLVKLAEFAEIQGGIQKQPKRQPKDNAYPFLRVANVTSSGLDLSEVHFIELFEDELQRLRLAVGDLLVVEGNGSPSQIGRAASWDGSIADCVHQNHLIRVRPKPGLLPGFLEAMWNSPQHRRQLTKVASSTSGLYTLSVSKLKRLELPFPDLEAQEAALGRIDTIRIARHRLDAENARARRRAALLRRATLAAAFSGRLTARQNHEALIEELAGV